MYAELAGETMQQPTQTQVPQQQPTTEQQPPVQQPIEQPQPEPSPEDIEAAKKTLGIDVVQSQLEELVTENVKQAVSAKYPDIPFDVVEKEIEKVAAIDPNFAKSMRTTPEGMDMAYRAAMAAIKPQEKPDNITDGDNGGGGQENSLDEAIAKGEADDVGLGDYILGIQ